MKLVKTASGKQTIKISKKEWTNIGKKAGWMKSAQFDQSRGTIEMGDTGQVQQASQELFTSVSQLTPDQKNKILKSLKATITKKNITEQEVNDLIANGLMSRGIVDGASLSNYIQQLN